MKLAFASAALIFLMLLSSVNAFDVAIFPAKQGISGWKAECFIEIYNNSTKDIVCKIRIENPSSHTRYNESGIFDTATNGRDMKEFEDLPDFSWIKVPKKIIIPAKNGSNYTVSRLPIKIDIPQRSKYAGKKYEVLIVIAPETNNTIKTTLASRLLIETPEMKRMPSLPFPFLFLLLLPLLRRSRK